MDMVVSSVDQSPLSASCFCLFKEVFSSPDAAKRTKFGWTEFTRHIPVTRPSRHQLIECVHVIPSILVYSRRLALWAEYKNVFCNPRKCTSSQANPGLHYVPSRLRIPLY